MVHLKRIGQGKACISADGGALVANDCGAFGFTKISPFILTHRDSDQ